MSRLIVTYHVRSDATRIAARARDIAVEQSVEMPLAPIDDDFVKSEIVGRVDNIADRGGGVFEVTIALSAATVGSDAAQLLNMLFGNTSLHDDVALSDVELPPELVRAFRGPNGGMAGLRRRIGAHGRALTCSALKPQGLPPRRLAALAAQLAQGGLDFIKDDHGLADQGYSPFAERVEACAAAVRESSRAAGHLACYVPSLSGSLQQLRDQMETVRRAGLDTVLIAPMIVGWSNMQELVRENPTIAFIAHPAMGGTQIAPPLLAKLFRLLGADGIVFPSYGGRFGYSPKTCREIARAALGDWQGVASSIPVPAGGMTLERVPELLDFYGKDVMLLIGGNLLSAGDRLVEEARQFTAAVARHSVGEEEV
jgi:ribulose-bisphosphate carboxylase large chain